MGVVFDIQKFCVNDGPGIRSVVFLKGCPLKCLWCHNPESNKKIRQLYCDRKKCTACGKCEEVCRQGVHCIKDGKHTIDYQKCLLCEECVKVCPTEAIGIYGKEMSVKEIVDIVIKDKEYYDNSSGGVTISGGEPMIQAEFSFELAKELKRQGIHVCMETSGFARSEEFMKIDPYIDLFLFDYKATGDKLHKKLTGVDGDVIIKNLGLLLQRKKNVRLRCPIIPGYNLTKEHLRAIAHFSRMGVSSVDIIPYHNMGISKAKNIGSDMYLEDVEVPTQEEVQKWMDYINDHGGKNIKKA